MRWAFRTVKASYEKINFPPAGVISQRNHNYAVVQNVETPDDQTVVLHLKQPSPSFLATLASPFDFIYKADVLKALLAGNFFLSITAIHDYVDEPDLQLGGVGVV